MGMPRYTLLLSRYYVAEATSSIAQIPTQLESEWLSKSFRYQIKNSSVPRI
jgi:hypothetical protein